MPAAGRARSDLAGSAVLTGFMVAVVIYASVFAVYLGQQQDASEAYRDAPRAPLLQSRAADALAVIVGTAGVGQAGYWPDDPEGLARLGLALQGSPQRLDPAKLEAMGRGVEPPDPASGRVEYAEARASLRLGDGLDFHLRSEAQLARLGAGEPPPLSLRLLYIGDFQQVGQNPPVERAESKAERGYLQALVQGFVNLTYDQGGDVYPDLKSVMDNDLKDNITDYDVVVAGSNIDHNAMTSAHAKRAVEDWVRAGGLLLVLGNDASQSIGWLEPLFKARTADGSGPVRVALPDHPILAFPEELQHEDYVENGRTVRFNTVADAAQFQLVIDRPAGGGREAVLALSQPGAHGDGLIVITSWLAPRLTSPQDDLEAKRFLYNALTQGEPVEVDLGPPVPGHTEVGSATRWGTLTVRGGQVLTVKVTLHVFGQP